MVRMNDIIKRWADFSVSETKPLFWMLLGPLLMMLTITLAGPHVANPFLPMITVVGLVLSWRYRLNGFALTLMMLVLYFVVTYLFGHKSAFFLKMGWGASLALGLTISFLSMEELKTYYAKMKQGKEKVLSELQISLHSFEEKTAVERRAQDREIEDLKEELVSSREEVEALLNLIEASRIESDKIYKQSDALSAESLEMHREIETLKLQLTEGLEKLTYFEKEHGDIAEIAGARLKTLNTFRVELYQARLLNDGYQKQIQRARDYFISQKKKPQETPVQENSQQLILQALEKDKGMIKKIYAQISEDYQKVRTALEEGTGKLQKAPTDALTLEVNKLSSEVEEKKRKLQHTKSELIDIEREIFVVKKGLQEKGSFAGS